MGKTSSVSTDRHTDRHTDRRRQSTCASTLSVSSASRKDGSDSVSLKTTTNATSASQEFKADQPMFFVEMNPYAPDTVVLLHVIFSCHLEWKEVWPKLPEYHLLMPDLPCHSKSKGVCRREDFSVGLCVELVADMIRTHAHDGRAHIVGISSAGGWAAMELPRKYPELCKSVYVSGAWPQTGMRATLHKNPRLIFAALWSLLHSPAGKKKFFQSSGLGGAYYNDELFAEIKGNLSSRLAVGGISTSWGYDWLEKVAQAGVRMVFVAGSVHDNLEHAQKAGEVVNSQENGIAYVYNVQGAAHAWNLQLPALFAKSIVCWVEGRPMPAEFEALVSP